MDSEKIKEVFEKSSEELFKHNHNVGSRSNVVVGVDRYEIVGTSDLLLTLADGIEDTIGAILFIGDELILGKDAVAYSFYDRNSKTLGIQIENPAIIGMINETQPELHLEFDLSFLVENARDYYKEFGDLIGYPEFAPEFSAGEVVFPAKFSPSEQQRNAVRTILNSRLSYVWGAPGTGKTQMVLATAIMAYLRRGSRVAIIAPTNNSVEQVLRGIIGVIESDEDFRRIVNQERDIARIGTATEQFIEDYPQLCEVQSIGSLMSKKTKETKLLQDVYYEKCLDRVTAHIRALETLFQERKNPTDRKTKRALDKQIDELLAQLQAVLSMNKLNQDLIRDLTPSNFEYQIEVIKKRLYQRSRPKNSIP